MTNELKSIIERYSKRNNISDSRYNPLSPSVYMGQAEKERVLAGMLNRTSLGSLFDKDILEIGCGSGSNLLQFIRLGANPENLWANELLDERLDIAKKNLSSSVNFLPGDAATLNISDESLDIVYQSTVFTSILDVDFQEKLASKIWSLLKPGGGILWYDFVYDNPGNKDVKGAPLKRMKALFPMGDIRVSGVTLVPPISRRVTKIHPSLYTVFNSILLLRTHILCWIQKSD